MPQTPFLTVDCVIFKSDSVLLIKRRNEPHKGCYALPGGFVDIGETVEQACSRELKEETGVMVNQEKLKLIGVYSDPARDERFHSVSIAFMGESSLAFLQAGDDAIAAELVKNWRDIDIAFDHKQIIVDAFNMKEQLKKSL